MEVRNNNLKLSRLSSLVRDLCIELFCRRGEGHLASSLSVVEILTALYWGFLKVDPSNHCWPNRDRFVLSKAHSSLAYYITLCLKGFIPAQWLLTYNKFGSNLPLEPDPDRCPGVDVPTGPLGTGLSKAIGISIASKLSKRDSKIVVLVGDGEMQKGQVWEAMAYAKHANLDNLYLIIDMNGRQLDGRVADILSIDLLKVIESLKWYVKEVDGHDIKQITDHLNESVSINAPVAILAKTIKGKGIVDLENDYEHHYYRANEMSINIPHISRHIDMLIDNTFKLEEYISDVH